MSGEGVIDPGEIPIPSVKPEDLRTAAGDIKGDGTDVSQAGQDIKSAWGGLNEVYAAPEAETLFSAIDPVAEKGDDFSGAVSTVGDALAAFADEAERIKGRLQGLKADAEEFVREIEDDDDWREDEDKVERHNTLNNDVLAAMNEYMAAERDCANKITAIFGGTTFVATAPGEEGSVGAGEQAHGYTEALKDVETPWATPQEHDAPWYEDVWDGVKDFGVGIAEDLGAMVGLYGEDGWGVGSWGEWGNNLKNNWGDTLNGLGSLVGLYGENGWGVGSFGEWWGNFSSGWTEFAHAVVPWREWGDRPGYVITQSVLNIGSMFVGGAGVYKALAQGARRVGGGSGDSGSEGSNGDSPDNTNADSLRGLDDFGDRPSTSGLQNSLNDLEIPESGLEGIDDTLNDASRFDRQPVPVDPAGHDVPGNGDTDPQGGNDPTALNPLSTAPEVSPVDNVDPAPSPHSDLPQRALDPEPGSNGSGDGGDGGHSPTEPAGSFPSGGDGPDQSPGSDRPTDGDRTPTESPDPGNPPETPEKPEGDGGPGGGDRDTPTPQEDRPVPATPLEQGDETPGHDGTADQDQDGNQAEEPEQDLDPAGDNDGSADGSEAPHDSPDDPGGDGDPDGAPPSGQGSNPAFYEDDGTRAARLAAWELHNHVPAHIRDATVAFMRQVPSGGISIGDAPLTRLPGGDVLPKGTPNGWPAGSSFDDVAGVWEPQSRRLLISTSRGSASTSVPLHEFGHAVDNAHGWQSSSQEWANIQQQTAGALQSKNTFNSYYNAPKEWWAESFASWCKGWDTMVQHALDDHKVAGILWDYFERTMGGP
ncbi:hypothetical protein GCM10027570_50910 [Streptomonospora sediminis]